MPRPRLRLRGLAAANLGRRAAAASAAAQPGVLRRRVFSTASAQQLAALRPASAADEPEDAGYAGINGSEHESDGSDAMDGLFEQLRASSAPSAAAARPEAQPFPWAMYDRACATCIDSPLDQLLLIRRQFVNRDGSRPVRDSDQHWAFLPNTALRQELSGMRERFVTANFAEPTRQQKLLKQKHLEKRAYEDALTRYNKLNAGFVERGQIEHHTRLQQQMRKWHKPLTLAIKQEQAAVEQHLPSVDRQTYGPYLNLLGADVLAVLTLHEVLSAVVGAGERGALFSRTALAVGKQVFMEVRAKQREDEKRLWIEERRLEKLKSDIDKLGGPGGGAEADPKYMARKARWTKKEAELEAKKEFARVEQWEAAIRVKLGGCLIGMMLGHVMIKDREGRVKFAVEHDYVHNMDKTVLGILRAQDAVLDLLKSDVKISSFVSTRQLPMIVEPRPWTDPDTGGYFDYPSFFMRVRHSIEHKEKLREVARQGALKDVFDGLNALGNVRWQINRRMFDVVNAVWEFGGGEGGLIEREMEEEPPSPQSAGAYEGREWMTPLTEAKQEEKNLIEAEWRRKMRETFKENRERHSLNCDTQLKLQVAKEFLQVPFYFPHNLDFRGRAYPIPPHLNHLGNDMCRGLLCFDEGKMLGEEGLYWLKLQVANLWGEDKLSNDDRVAFVDSNLDMVRHNFRSKFVKCRSAGLARDRCGLWLRIPSRIGGGWGLTRLSSCSLRASTSAMPSSSTIRRATSPTSPCTRTARATACSTTLRWLATSEARSKSTSCPRTSRRTSTSASRTSSRTK